MKTGIPDYKHYTKFFKSKEIIPRFDVMTLMYGEVYDTVPCPPGYYPDKADGTWVYSKARKEPVMLLPHEFID